MLRAILFFLLRLSGWDEDDDEDDLEDGDYDDDDDSGYEDEEDDDDVTTVDYWKKEDMELEAAPKISLVISLGPSPLSNRCAPRVFRRKQTAMATK